MAHKSCNLTGQLQAVLRIQQHGCAAFSYCRSFWLLEHPSVQQYMSADSLRWSCT